MSGAALLFLWVLSLVYAVAEGGPICNYTGISIKGNPNNMQSSHVFDDPVFWQHFEHKVKSKSWKCNFPSDVLLENLDKDAMLYKDATILRSRRNAALNWIRNDALWINLILGACKEIVNGKTGTYSLQLQRLHMLEALADFVEHLNCFYVVASEMRSKGWKVKPLSQDSSQVHDIDKLDPVMIVGYSERFEDNQATSVWDTCVDRHTHVNPHHQAHSMWDPDCGCGGNCTYCQDIKEKALHEMVCDKVSRRLQKNLNGMVSDDMWNVDLVYFKGLPPTWLNKATHLMRDMQQ